MQSKGVWGTSPTSIFATQNKQMYIRLHCLLQLCWFWKVHSQWAIQTPKPKLQLRCAERTLPCLSYHARNRKLFSAISIAAFDWRRLSYQRLLSLYIRVTKQAESVMGIRRNKHKKEAGKMKSIWYCNCRYCRSILICTLYRVPDSGILQVRLNQRTGIYVYSSGRFFGNFTSSL